MAAKSKFPQCKQPFTLVKAWQKFCSAACRLKAWRKSKKAKEGKSEA